MKIVVCLEVVKAFVLFISNLYFVFEDNFADAYRGLMS